MAYLFSHRSGNFGNPNRETVIITPPTTDLALVFPFEKSSNKFDRNFYSPALTDGRVSVEQVDNFLRKVEQVIKRNARKVKIASFILGFILISGFCATVFSMFGGLDESLTEEEIDYDDPDTVFFMLFAFLFIAVFSSLGFNAYVKHKGTKAKKRIQSIVEKTSRVLSPLGLRWNMPLHFPHWIELWKDYKAQPQSAYQPPLMPQNYMGNCNEGQLMQQRQNSNPRNAPSQQNQQNEVGFTIQQPLIGRQRYPDFSQFTPLDV
jgi:hypothetical protein